MKSLPIRPITLTAIILATALFRLVPHWPNFTPIAALALFGAAMFERKWLGLVAPLVAMLLSDALIGFHGSMGAVYFSFGLTWLLGCYVSGLAFYNGTSFFLNGLAGDLFFSALLFGGYYLLQLRFGRLKPVRVRNNG